MYCKKCGAFNDTGARFCTVCGTSLSDGFVNEQRPAHETDARTAGPYYESGSYRYDEQTRNQNEPFHIDNINRNGGQPGGCGASDPSSPESYINPSFGEAIRSFFLRYIDFSGRSSRAEYWFVFLLNFIITTAIGFLAKNVSNAFGILDTVYSLAVLIPMLAIDFRRLHDTGRSGWFLLLWFIPIIGWIILLVYHCQGSEGPNIYGPEPKRK